MIRFSATLAVWLISLALALLLHSASPAESPHLEPSLVITMICRDEAVNFRANLAKWASIADYYVFLLDSRTVDDSATVIRDILSAASKKDIYIQYYNFTGFGPARTLSLKIAWDKYPQASHVLIADPDWRPDISTMSLRDLQEGTDVYRFTAFDRNGFSKRKMDWLLRHREGLAMKYHLHEVLDIGMYNVTSIPWVVHEIEQPGSWHTTVGHNHSMSAERFKFDLALLYKDLDLYGHDPHTHYYLGVTHEACAMQLLQRRGRHHPEVQEHLRNATSNMELRAVARYEDEFVEQRWAAMLQLGVVYSNTVRDDVKAIHWLSMCRDYRPSQSECSLGLCRLYLKLGQLSPALAEIHRVLQQGREEREMLEYLTHWDCRVPLVAAQLFATKAIVQGVEADEAMYFFHLWRLANVETCGPTGYEVELSARQALIEAIGGLPVDHFHSRDDFCGRPELQAYLLRNQYRVHRCAAVLATQTFSQACMSLTATAPPPYEDFHANALIKAFYGAAILPDIVHHAFQGRSGAFLTKGRPLRFLFAEHFHPEMVLNLLGQLQRQAVADFEIVVVSPADAFRAFLLDRFSFCARLLNPDTVDKVRIYNTSLLQYAAQHGGQASQLFDYIEYNGGLSKANDSAAELRALHALLHDQGGAIGLTYFTSNHHVTRLRALVDSRDRTHMVPFSLEATRLVKAYLAQHKLSALAQDTELVAHLGGEIAVHEHPLYQERQTEPRAQWRTYTQAQATALVEEAGFEVASWVPTAYSHPFEEMTHYEAQKYADAGVAQEDYVGTLMTTFRYTQYLVKRDRNTTADDATMGTTKTGRRNLTRAIFRTGRAGRTAASSLHVEDRVGYLGSTFAGMEALALQRLSTAIEFAHHALPGETRFGLVVSPVIAPCLAQLSSRPTIQDLHDVNRAFARREGREFDEAEAQDLLLALLAFVEGRNMITYYSFTDYDGDNFADDDRLAGGDPSERKATTPSSVGSAPRVVGGLRVKMNSPPAASAVEQDAAAKEHDLPGPLTKRWLDKNPTPIENLRKLGHPYSVIEEILISEARREEARSAKKKNKHQDAGTRR